MSALPPKADIDHDGGNVRFVPKADVSNRSKKCLYSITSSARANTLGGTSKASALEVLMLSTGFVFRRSLHREVGWFLAFQDAVD